MNLFTKKETGLKNVENKFMVMKVETWGQGASIRV